MFIAYHKKNYPQKKHKYKRIIYNKSRPSKTDSAPVRGDGYEPESLT